jgi:hypothetical protein
MANENSTSTLKRADHPVDLTAPLPSFAEGVLARLELAFAPQIVANFDNYGSLWGFDTVEKAEAGIAESRTEGTNCENLPATHAFLRRVRREIDAMYPDTVLLAEANQWPEDVVDYFGDYQSGGDECHMAFHFPVMPRIFMAVRRGNPATRSRNPAPRPRPFPRTASGASSCATTTS